ncbi:MAG TPA: hypothetical protein VJN68_13215 [Burkholderiaceae bacterium]|nr:hypothetical protein [Burkholderiaceae bacterium]
MNLNRISGATEGCEFERHLAGVRRVEGLQRKKMKRMIGEWLWRVALLSTLAWIGYELHSLHQDLQPSPDEQAVVASTPDDAQDGLDAVRDDLEDIKNKVNAILVVLARSV